MFDLPALDNRSAPQADLLSPSKYSHHLMSFSLMSVGVSSTVTRLLVTSTSDEEKHSHA